MADVTIYTRKFCGFCTAAKRLLNDKGVRFDEHDATMNPALRAEMIERSGGGWTFPQIFVGSTHIGGCNELYEWERKGDLDRLLQEAGAG
ncbi:MAG: glutaredoxin 3 [Alphaproteobacteria bacterium]